MKIENISIQNFKTFGLEKIELTLNDLTALIGENSVGKSNVLEALDLFFNFTKTKVSTKSYHHNNYSKPIIIRVKFKNLNLDELTTFKTHLDKQNDLTITQYIEAISKEDGVELKDASIEDIDFIESKHGTKQIPTKEYLWTIADKNPTKANLKKWWISDLKIGDFDFKTLFDSEEEPTQGEFRDKLIQLNEEHYDAIPKEQITGDEKVLGWKSKLKANLPKFFYIPAIKNLSEDLKVTKTSALGELINWLSSSVSTEIKQEFKTKTDALVKELIEKIDTTEKGESKIQIINKALNDNIGFDIGCSLELKFGSPEIQDVVFPQPKVFANDGYDSELTEKGHGIQRLALFSLLRTYNTFDFGKNTSESNIIIGLEEPEIYLHPPLKRATYNLLKEISEGSDQVIYTTHDSLFISVDNFDQIRLFRKSSEENPKTVSHELGVQQIINHYKNLYGKEVDELSIRHRFHHLIDETKNEGFFAKKIVLIEGETEKYSLPNYFRSKGFDIDTNRISLINAGSVDTIPYLLLLFNEFRIPCYVIFDGDKPSKPVEDLKGDVRKDAISKSNRNKAILQMLGHQTTKDSFFFPQTNINSNYSIWEKDFEEEFHKNIENYEEIKAEAKKLYNNNSKPLTARYFSEKICKTPDKIDKKIDLLIEKIIELEWTESIIERI
ncbi:ATP-dependent endonuclease [Polaribacter sp. KT 15]|uniref:ATP-dependent nuclease n=1 Tax=Polaribacter sp. KT 15 TaxID=1896175 RepID=UPI00090C75BA|nr:ATP-dependent endonuclease [Polaribacter sp. KT 15]SHN06522.1 AAA ATPase domain-containing protein [Polaribacter sp. KT 15]